MTLFKGAISIVSNNPYEVLVSKGAAGKLVNKSQGQKRELIILLHKEYSSFCYDLFDLCFDVITRRWSAISDKKWNKNSTEIRKGILD